MPTIQPTRRKPGFEPKPNSRTIQMRFMVNTLEYDALLKRAESEGVRASEIIRRGLRAIFEEEGLFAENVHSAPIGMIQNPSEKITEQLLKNPPKI